MAARVAADFHSEADWFDADVSGAVHPPQAVPLIQQANMLLGINLDNLSTTQFLRGDDVTLLANLFVNGELAVQRGADVNDWLAQPDPFDYSARVIASALYEVSVT